jgi:predicted ribosome quality control (RQC) complex YloA/Tae2 family protein
MERTAIFTFDCFDELGDPVRKKLVAELMGRTCNLYLLSPEDRIIDCLRRVGLDESSKRQALPGLYYQNPEPVTKKHPLELTEEDYAVEEIMLSLRTKQGMDIERLVKSNQAKSYAALLVKQGYGNVSENRFFLTPKGMLVSNEIISEFLCYME